MVATRQITSFAYVHEWDDDFLALFPHRYDYIWSKRPQSGQKPSWQSESRHPLSDRLIQQGNYLYGVRFGQTTNYLLIDLDSQSQYHPDRDPLALHRLLAALEVMGLVTHVACSSSYSGGMHLYFPFESAQNAYQLAAAATAVLANAGFMVAPGQLELFPHTKLYASDGPSLFNAHRLPLQEPGAYLLNRDWQAIHTSQTEFVRQWQFAQARNVLDRKTLDRLLNTYQRRYRRISTHASKFLADLDTEIESGWTGPGQTNHLLGRIAMRTYVFAHLIQGGVPLQGQPLVKAIVATARALPGFAAWCRHQHELDKKATEWARSVEASNYYPYGYRVQTAAPASPSWNQQQQAAARERIQQAIANLCNQEQLPMGITDRRKALIQYGISHSTLSKYKDLWHPHFLTETPVASEAQLQPTQTDLERTSLLEPLPGRPLQPSSPNKLECSSVADASQRQTATEHTFDVGGVGGLSTTSESPPSSSEVSPGDLTVITALSAIDPTKRSPIQSVPAVPLMTPQHQTQAHTLPMVLAPDGSQVDPDSLAVKAAIGCLVHRLGWALEQVKQFIHQVLGKTLQTLAEDDWILLLYQLQNIAPPLAFKKLTECPSKPIKL